MIEEDYLDSVVAGMCDWLAPTVLDEESVKIAKLEFSLKLRTTSIPLLKGFLSGIMPIFGTRDTFLTQTFIKLGKGKEFATFKEVLQSYSTLLTGNDMRDNAKLVEELLNYAFFQKRFRQNLDSLQQLDLNQVRDPNVRKILAEMKEQDVLAYGEIQATILAQSVAEAITDYLNKKSINPSESIFEKAIEKVLISYSQIDYFSRQLRAGNPKILDFHEK